MSVTSFIALRYLKANRENRFFSWISTLSIIGIAIGVAAMIVVLSVISGFENELRNRFLAANAHVLIYRFPAGLKNHEKWQQLIQKDFGSEITGTSPFVHFDTMCRKDYIIHAILIKGIIPSQRKHVQDLNQMVRPSSAIDMIQAEQDAFEKTGKLPDLPSIIVGSGLLSALSAKPGEILELVAPDFEKAREGDFGAMQRFQIIGIYESGLSHFDDKLGITSVASAQHLFSMGELVTGLEVGLKNPETSRDFAERISDHYSDLSIREWQSFNRSVFEAMRTEKNVIGLIVALVAFVASFNILTTLFISVTQRRRDISILKALGASNGQILVLFLKQSSLIGIVGGTAGLVMAFAIAKFIQVFPLIRLPDIYLLKALPVSYDWRVYVLVAVSGIVIAAFAGLYPAWSATRITPTEGLREARRK